MICQVNPIPQDIDHDTEEIKSVLGIEGYDSEIAEVVKENRGGFLNKITQLIKKIKLKESSTGEKQSVFMRNSSIKEGMSDNFRKNFFSMSSDMTLNLLITEKAPSRLLSLFPKCEESKGDSFTSTCGYVSISPEFKSKFEQYFKIEYPETNLSNSNNVNQNNKKPASQPKTCKNLTRGKAKTEPKTDLKSIIPNTTISQPEQPSENPQNQQIDVPITNNTDDIRIISTKKPNELFEESSDNATMSNQEQTNDNDCNCKSNTPGENVEVIIVKEKDSNWKKNYYEKGSRNPYQHEGYQEYGNGNFPKKKIMKKYPHQGGKKKINK